MQLKLTLYNVYLVVFTVKSVALLRNHILVRCIPQMCGLECEIESSHPYEGARRFFFEKASAVADVFASKVSAFE